VKPHPITLLASIALAGGAALTALAPAAQAQTFDPCAATNHGTLKYPTGSATHVVFAISSSYSSNYVVVTECVKQKGSWKKISAVHGRAGTNAFAPPGEKREGDGRTPTGSFTLTEAFGVGDPGTGLKYRKLRSSGDCWGSTPGKSHYNEYYSATSCRSTDENLSAIARRGTYHQAVVIDYNRPHPKPGYGSAIFFHVGGVTPTAGCISIPEPELRAVMRTLVPNDRMIMGPKSALFRS
jgi:L,D-peptidoglycan transpeptidase YkuD (ErfK/YbiS/YcfS/YnhG family)